MPRHLILFAALLALMLMPMAVRAQSCASSVTPLSFGTISGAPTPATDTTATITVNCQGTANTSVRVCLGINAGSAPSTVTNRLMVNGASAVAYQISTSSGGPNWGDYLGGGNGVEANVAIPSSGLGTAVVTVFGRVTAGQNVPAGLHTSNLTLTGRQPSGNSPCINLTGTSFPNSGFAATVLIAGSCSIVANDLAFGARSSLASAVIASTAIGLTCTAGTPWTVKLDGGLIGGAVSNRRMGFNGIAPGVIGYQLFRDSARSQVWGDTAGSTVTGVGTGAASTLTVYGRVPGQATPAAGNYHDTVTATVEY